MQIRPRIRPPPAGDLDLGAVAADPRQPVAVPDRHQAERGRRGRRSRCGRRRRRRPPRRRLTIARLARAVIAGRSPRSGVSPGAGSRPYDAMPTRTRSSRQLGRRIAAAELARWRTSGVEPGARRSSASSNSRLLRVVGRVVRLVAAGEVRPDAGDHDPALSSSPGPRLGEQDVPVVERGATSAQPGVDLELDPRAPAGRGDGVELGDGVGRDVDVLLDRGAPVVAGHGEPAEHPAGVAGLAQRPAPRRWWRRRASRRPPSRAARADSASPWP